MNYGSVVLVPGSPAQISVSVSNFRLFDIGTIDKTNKLQLQAAG